MPKRPATAWAARPRSSRPGPGSPDQRAPEGERARDTPPGPCVVLAESHTAQGPGGVSLALSPFGPRWSGEPGPGRLLRGLAAQVVTGRYGIRRAPLELSA